MDKGISLEIAVDDERGEPLATFNLITYPPTEQMYHFCSFSENERLGLDTSAEHDDLYPGILLYPEEVELVESERVLETRLAREKEFTRTFIGNKEELYGRFARFHYNRASLCVQELLGKENELHEVSKLRARYNGYSSDEALLAFHIARRCAPLCEKVFEVPYQTVYECLQEYWKNIYSKAKHELSELVNHKSELIRNGGIALNLRMMARAAERIDCFNRAELQEFKEKYGKK